MNRTLAISFSLKNTYRVNSILYSLKQIPLLKKVIPATVYRVRGFKIFANILSIVWEIASTFVGKALYLFLMVSLLAGLYTKLPSNQSFLHILLFLSIIGSFTNTKLFSPSKDKYYAMILMRMDARAYTITNYFYFILKVVVGFMPFTLVFGLSNGVALWCCLMLPFCIAGLKLFVAACYLWVYEKQGRLFHENNLSKYEWIVMALLLIGAYGLPVLGIALPSQLSMMAFLVCLLLGCAGATKVLGFQQYSVVNKELLHGLTDQMDKAARTRIIKQANEQRISTDAAISSKRKGFEYLNELFIKRHQKILWRSTQKIVFVCLGVIAAVQLVFVLRPEVKPFFNEWVLNWLPYFAIIMYAVNRGTGFTQALFMNCDHSLLTYSFFKQPAHVLRLFQIRLREIMKINAVPALVIGCGLALILFTSGGTDNPLNYLVLIVSILSMSMFFSIHYLTIYYLLQPYNAGTEIKSGTYRIVVSATYIVCYVLMQVHMPTLLFGAITIAFCVIYSIIACVLVYRYAPKTFRLRV
ncbi:MAG: hypothetical protein UDG94_11400 [Peptococcaceae bacterium]|nr:hypothetical protein [Peptococcaceae bacterium]